VVITSNHAPAIHVYLILFTVVGLWLTAEPHRPWLRLLVLLAGFAPMFGTAVLPAGLSWITPNTVTIIAVAALHAMAIIDRIVRQEEELTTPDLIALHLTGLGLFALLYEALRPAYPNFRGGLAALIAFGAIGLWQWWQSRDRVASLNAAALAFTLAALGVAVQFDGPAVVFGWAAEGTAAVWAGWRCMASRSSNSPTYTVQLRAASSRSSACERSRPCSWWCWATPSRTSSVAMRSRPAVEPAALCTFWQAS
jgi:hypothetical protein